MKDAKEWMSVLAHQEKTLEEYEMKLGRGLYLATDIKVKKEETKEEE